MDEELFRRIFHPDRLPEDLVYLQKSITDLRVAELKMLCKSTGLSVKGRKQEIVDRIYQFCHSLFVHEKKTEILAMEAVVLCTSLGFEIKSLSSVVQMITHTPERFRNYVGILLHANPHRRPPFLAATRNDPAAFAAECRALATDNQNTNPEPAAQPSLSPPAFVPHPGPSRNSPVAFPRTLFYTPHVSVGRVQVLKVSKGRGILPFQTFLNPLQIELLRRGPHMRVFLFCCIESTPDPKKALLQYPPIEIYVEGVLTKQSVKGIKGKPGTARPADLTPYITSLEKPFHVRIVYSDAAEQYFLSTYIAEVHTPDAIMAQIVAKPHISLASTKQGIKEENERNEMDEIVVDNVSLTLRCPITYAKMSHPVKSIQCDHVQCFDGLSFLTMQEQIPVWQCPVCSKSIDENSLAVSDYLRDILENTSQDVYTVLMHADGSWTPVSEEEEKEERGERGEKDESAKSAAAEEIEIISLDSDSESDAQPDTFMIRDLSMRSPPTVSVSMSGSVSGAVSEQPARENTSILDATMVDADETNSEVRVPETGHVTTRTEVMGEIPMSESDPFDDEVIVNRRKRARLMSDSSAGTSNTSTPGDNLEPTRPEFSSDPQNSIAPSTTEALSDHTAAYHDDTPISQYLAQRDRRGSGSFGSSSGERRSSVHQSLLSTANGCHGSAQLAKSSANDNADGNERKDHVEENGETNSRTGVISQNAGTSGSLQQDVKELSGEKESDSSVSSTAQNPPVEKEVSTNETSANAASQISTQRGDVEVAQLQSNSPVAGLLQITQTNEESENQSPVDSSASRFSSMPGVGSSSAVTQKPEIIQSYRQESGDHLRQGMASAVSGISSDNDQPAAHVSDESSERRPSVGQSLQGSSMISPPNHPQHHQIYPQHRPQDDSIPAVWQNKENHSRGLERISSTKSQNQSQSIPYNASSKEVTLSHHGPREPPPTVQETSSSQSAQRSQISPEADIPNGVSIISRIQDQVSRACSPVPVSEGASNASERQGTQSGQANPSFSHTPSALVESRGQNNTGSTKSPVQEQRDAPHIGIIMQPEVSSTTTSDAGSKDKRSPYYAYPTLPHAGGPRALSEYGTGGNTSGPAARYGPHMGSYRPMPSGPASPLVPAHETARPNLSGGPSWNNSNTGNHSGQYRVRQAFSDYQSRNLAGHGSNWTAGSNMGMPNPQTFTNPVNSHQEVVHENAHRNNPHQADLAAFAYNQYVDGSPHPRTIRMDRSPHAGGAISVNSTHQQNVRMSSSMIHAYHRRVSESVVPENRAQSVQPAQVTPARPPPLGSQTRGHSESSVTGARHRSSITDDPSSSTPNAVPSAMSSNVGNNIHIENYGVRPLVRNSSTPNEPQSTPSKAVEYPHEPGEHVRQTNVLAPVGADSVTAISQPTGGPRYSRSAFDVMENPRPVSTVKGILGIELSRMAFQPTRENTPAPPSPYEEPKVDSRGHKKSNDIERPIEAEQSKEVERPREVGRPRESENTAAQFEEPEHMANTTFSPLNNRIEDMALHTPSSKKRTISLDSAAEQTWNKRSSKPWPAKTRFDPSTINSSDIIELDD